MSASQTMTKTMNAIATATNSISESNVTVRPSTYLQWFEAVKDADIELVQKLHAANPSISSLQYNDQVPYDSLMESEATRLLGADTTNMTALQYGLIHFDAEDEQPELGRTMDELIDDRKQVIEFLISVSTPDEFNAYRWGASNTALHLASFLGEASIVQQLLAHGATASVKNDLGQTPKDVALDEETRNAFDQPQSDIDNFMQSENLIEPTAETKLSVLATRVRKTSLENLESRGELDGLSPTVFPEPRPSTRTRTNSLPLPFVVSQPKANDAKTEDPKPNDSKTEGPKPKPKEAIVALRQNLLVSNSVFLNSNSSSPNVSSSTPTSSSPGKRPNYSSANRFSELKLLAESTAVVPAVVSPSTSAKTVSPSTPPKRSFTLPSFGGEQEPTKNIKTGRKSETADLAKKSAVRNNPFLRSVEDLTSFSSSHKASHAKVSVRPPSPKKETNKDGSVSPQANRTISPSVSSRSISPTSSGTASPTISSRTTSPSSSTEVKKPAAIKKDEPKKKQSGISAGFSALSQNTLVSNSVFKRRTDSAKPVTPPSRGTTVSTTRPMLNKRKSQEAVERKEPEAPVRPMLYKSKSQETVERKKPETPVRPTLSKTKSQEAVARKEQEVAAKERPQQKKENPPAADSDLNTVLVLEEAKVVDEAQDLNGEVVLEPDNKYTSFTNIEDQLPAAETAVTFEDDATVSFAPATSPVSTSPLSTSPVNLFSTSPSNSSPRSILRSKGKEAPTAPVAPAPTATVHRNGSGRSRGSRPGKLQQADRRKSVTWNELAEVREIVELIEYEDDGFDSYGSSDDDYMSDEDMDDDEYHPREQIDDEDEEVEAEERMLKRLNGPSKTVWSTETEVSMSAESSDEEEEVIVSRPKEDAVTKEAEPVEAKVNGEQDMDQDILAQGLDDEAGQSNDAVAEPIQDAQDEDIINALVEKSSESPIQASAPIPIPGAVSNRSEDQTSYFDVGHPTSTISTPATPREWTFADVLTNENGATQARSTRLQRGEVKAKLTEWRRSKSYETPHASPKAPPPVPQLSTVTVMGENDGKKVNGIFKKILNKASGQLKRTNSWSALKTANASMTGIDHVFPPAGPQEPATQPPLDVSEPEQSSASQEDSGRSSFSSLTSATSIEQEPELRASSPKLSSTIVQQSPPLGPTLNLDPNPAPKQSTSSSSADQDPELRATSSKLSSTILQQRSPSLSPSPAPIRSSSSSSSASSFDLRRTSASSDSSYSRSPVRSATTSFIEPVLPIGIAKPSPSNSSSSQRGASLNVSPSVSMLPSLAENGSRENLHVIGEDRNVKNRLSSLVELKRQQKTMEAKQQIMDTQDEEDDGEETDVGEDDQEAKVMGYDDLSGTHKTITSMSKLELEGLRRRDFLLDLPNSNGFERSLLESFDRIVDDKQAKKYVARRTSKVIHASASVKEDTPTSTNGKSPYSKHLPERAFDSQESIGGEYGPTWKVEQDAQRGGTFTKSKRVPSLKPRMQEPTGKLYVRLVSVSDIGVPMSKEPTYVRCVLNDGRYEHFTKYTQLGRNVTFEQEFQIVTRPDSEFSLTLHVRNDQSTKHRPSFARVFSSARRNIDPLAAYTNKEDGAIGQTYIALRDVLDDCRFKVCESTFACVNDWVVEPGTKRGSMQRKTKEFMMGKMTVQMFYLPAAEKMTEIPRNLEECKEALSIREWHQNCWHSGHMSQMGGDLNFWRRRHYRLVGSRLLAYHDLHHTPRAAIDLSKAVRLTADNQVIVGHPGAMKPMSGPASSGVPRRISIVSISPSIAVSVNEIDEDLFCAVKKSFRITFYNGEKIDFFCDTDEERNKWVEVLGGIVGKVPVWPEWLTEGREDIVV